MSISDTPVTARIPGSKSITNRALLLAAAAWGTSTLVEPLVSDDTVAFRAALEAVGVVITDTDGAWQVQGLGQGPHSPARIWCNDAGTAARFLVPFAAAGKGHYVVDGSDQLRRRPLEPLVLALKDLGANISAAPGGHLPLEIEADGLGGGRVVLQSSSSSQFLTGLLLSAPIMASALSVVPVGLVSEPYIAMTRRLMEHFGATVNTMPDGEITVPATGYTPAVLQVEPDASTASYFLAASAVTGQPLTIRHLGSTSLQGDVRFAEVLRLLGAEVDIQPGSVTVRGDGQLRGGFEIDMGDISDTFMTLAAIATLADAPITITGVAHARLKESDRVAVMASNLARCGVACEEGPDRLTIMPSSPQGALVACHRDHRIAMSFSVLKLRTPGIELDDPNCVSKTFPGFYAEFERLFLI